MKILYYDCFSGISGDMNIAAFIDLGVNKDYLLDEISKLNVDGFSINIEKGKKSGITGTCFNVILEEHNHNDEHHHEHRSFSDIKEIINSSTINDNVKRISINIFDKIAEAEGKVHGVAKEQVHFHEVGAIDSIVDVVGAAICIDYIKPDKIISSTVELGSGIVNCAHGVLPVPAPAVTEILKNIPVKSENVPFEATTPTGAAILAANVDEFTDNKNFKITNVGYGLGNKDGIVPNALRVLVCEETTCVDEKIKVLECNIDDMNPEIYGYIVEKLLDNGALDVFITPIIMKKVRPANLLTILCTGENQRKLEEIVFKDTTTLGIREYTTTRKKLQRKTKMVETKYGNIEIKESYYNGERLKYKPEFECCKKAAILNDVPISKIYEEVAKNG